MKTTKKQQIAMINMKIIHHNIRGLNNKINDLKNLHSRKSTRHHHYQRNTKNKTKHKNIQLHHNTTRRQHRTRNIYYTQKQHKNWNI